MGSGSGWVWGGVGVGVGSGFGAGLGEASGLGCARGRGWGRGAATATAASSQFVFLFQFHGPSLTPGNRGQHGQKETRSPRRRAADFAKSSSSSQQRDREGYDSAADPISSTICLELSGPDRPPNLKCQPTPLPESRLSPTGMARHPFRQASMRRSSEPRSPPRNELQGSSNFQILHRRFGGPRCPKQISRIPHRKPPPSL